MYIRRKFNVFVVGSPHGAHSPSLRADGRAHALLLRPPVSSVYPRLRARSAILFYELARRESVTFEKFCIHTCATLYIPEVMRMRVERWCRRPYRLSLSLSLVVYYQRDNGPKNADGRLLLHSPGRPRAPAKSASASRVWCVRRSRSYKLARWGGFCGLGFFFGFVRELRMRAAFGEVEDKGFCAQWVADLNDK